MITKYRAKTSFAGVVTMYKGETGELDSSLVSELVKCGYLVPVKEKMVRIKESNRNRCSDHM